MAFPVNNEVEWDRCETHQLYRNQSAAFGMDHLDTRGGDWELDKISSTTVARINLRRVATTRASVLGEWGLAIDMLHGVLSVPLQPDWESVVAEAKLSVPPADAFGGRFLESLTTESGLLLPHGTNEIFSFRRRRASSGSSSTPAWRTSSCSQSRSR